MSAQTGITFYLLFRVNLQNAPHFVGMAYPPNGFLYKSTHLCKRNSHFRIKIHLTLINYSFYHFVSLFQDIY